MRINADRTITVDETIQLVPLDSGPVGDLVVAESPPNSRNVHYLVNRATIGDKTASPLVAKPDDNGDLVVSIPTSASNGPVQIHVNYSVLGAFTDRSGGTLGPRSTLSWNLVPTSWPSKIENSLLEVGYPTGVVPVYTGANMGSDGSRASIEKSPDSAFTGSVSTFNVSEVRDGIQLQPASIATKAGMHLLIAISRKDLKPAPAKLVPPPVPVVSHSAPPSSSHTKPATGTTKPSRTAPPQPKTEPGAWMLGLPAAVPVIFFFAFYRRLKFTTGHGFATSAVPEGVGPAEAGYLLEGSLKTRHVLGAISAVVGGRYSQPDSATIDPAAIGPVERKAIELLKNRSSISDPKEIKTYLNGYLQELQGLLTQNLVSLNLLDTPSQVGRYGPILGAVVALVVTGGVAMNDDMDIGGAVTLGAVLVTAWLLFSLSSLTKRGLKAKLRVMGLHKFLSAHASELKSDAEPEYLSTLKPFAVAFGLAKEDGS
jgi:hypothetical protein